MWGDTSLFGPIKALAGNYLWIPRTDKFLDNHQRFPDGPDNFHGSAEVRYRVKEGSNDEFKNMVPEKELGNKPLIGLRVYPDIVGALGHGLYQDCYGRHRTNIVGYQVCKWGVYAYPDMREAVESIQSEPGPEKKVIGVVAGFVNYTGRGNSKQGCKLTLKPDSAVLLGVLVRDDYIVSKPFTVPEEDKAALLAQPKYLYI